MLAFLLLSYITIRNMMKLVLVLLLDIILFKDIRPHRVVKISDDITVTSNGIDNPKSQDILQRRASKSSSFHSFVDLLVNVTSNVSMYVTTDMVLPSVIQLIHLENIAVIGYNNPTVQCGYSGGLHFVSCHNITIEDITWNECGKNTITTTTAIIGLYMYNSIAPFKTHLVNQLYYQKYQKV